MTRRFAIARASFDAARRPAGAGPERIDGHGFVARAWAPARHPGADEQLEAALNAAVAPLDGVLLNSLLTDSGDVALARWLAPRIQGHAPLRMEIAHGPGAGASVDTAGPAYLWRRLRFEAAHRLPHVPADHKCARLHGHGFEAALHVRAQGRDEDGAGLTAAGRRIAERLHGVCLNDVPGLDNPTSERLAQWIWRSLAGELDLSSVSVFETCTSGCRFDGRDTRIWKSSRFEAALATPDGLSGHSYRVRLHAGGTLDPVLGWVLDYGEMKALFEPLYRRLDHHRLDEVLGGAATPAAVAQWILDGLTPSLPRLAGVDVWPTPNRGILVRREPTA